MRLPNTLPSQRGGFASLAHDTFFRGVVAYESVRLRLGAVTAALVQYFQQIRPLAKCDAEDGRVVGQLLVDLASSNPKDLARSIREFADRTAMLRDCGFAHIGEMLARLLSADGQTRRDDDATAIPSTPRTAAAGGPNRSALTEKQAVAIGCAIASSVHQAHTLAAGLNKVVQSHRALQARNRNTPGSCRCWRSLWRTRLHSLVDRWL